MKGEDGAGGYLPIQQNVEDKEPGYYTYRQDYMRYPERPEGTRLLFYNLHLPGRKGRPGTPVGVVALLVSNNIEIVARGIAVRSLMDRWDAGEGRIRAAGRAIRAYKRHVERGEDIIGHFYHEHAQTVVAMHNMAITKYMAPATVTPREYRLIEKKFGAQVRAEHGVYA